MSVSCLCSPAQYCQPANHCLFVFTGHLSFIRDDHYLNIGFYLGIYNIYIWTAWRRTDRSNIMWDYVKFMNVNVNSGASERSSHSPHRLSLRLTRIIQAELFSAGEMRRSLFMRMWLSSSSDKLTTREILSSRYNPERGASLRFACSKVIPRCDTPPSLLCMQRCHFNEGSELNILPVSCKFTLTWLLLKHKILSDLFMCWKSGSHGIIYRKSYYLSLP